MEKSVSYRIVPELKVILCHFQGAITLDDVVKINLQFINDKAFDLSFDVILDFRDSIALGYRMEVFEYVEFLKRTIKLKRRVKVAILTNSINQEFLVGAYIPIAKVLRMDVAKFYRMEECLQWMGYSEEQQLAIHESFKGMRSSALSVMNN